MREAVLFDSERRFPELPYSRGKKSSIYFVPVLTSFFAPDFFPTATAALEIGAKNQKERPNAPRPTSQIPGYATASLLCRFTEAVVDAFLSL